MKTELHIPSDLKFMGVAENWLLESLSAELKDCANWPQMVPRLRLALVEAYSNVVRHAHQDNPSIPVVIRLELDENAISLEIWDTGAGYDVRDYTAPIPDHRQEGGYGWMILTRLMDTVQYQRLAQEGRNCLKLEARLSPLHPIR